MPTDPRSRVRLGVLVLFLALGAYLRLRGVGDVGLFGDEYHTLLAADSSYGSILTTFDGVGSHVPLPLLQRLSLDVFGPGLVSFRLVALVPGILTLLLAYPLLKGFVGDQAALLATCLLAINPMHVYYSRFARGYALALLLALVLGWALLFLLGSAQRKSQSKFRTWGALVACAALLPWVHLSTLGFVLALALSGVVLAARESRALALRLGLAFGAAAVLSFLLFLPVLDQVQAFFESMQDEAPPSSWLGVPTLIAGSRAAAWAWSIALPIAVLALGRERRVPLVLALAALLGPLALLFISRPAGMDYAWARYLLTSLPFLTALVAAAFTDAARLCRLAEPFTLLGGVLLCLAQYLTGPLRPGAPDDGGFSNTYLALHPLPAFDQPFTGAPDFYRELAADPSVACIVEAPPLYTRALLMYRNYALVHGKRVRLGWVGDLPRGVQSRPYASLFELAPGEVDYVILHRDQPAEVTRYFSFVLGEAWTRLEDSSDETFMHRYQTIFGETLLGPDETDPMAARLRTTYGTAYYKDENVLVWKLGH